MLNDVKKDRVSLKQQIKLAIEITKIVDKIFFKLL